METSRSTEPPMARSGVILVTGSEGAIGRHLARSLQEGGHAVRGLDLRPTSLAGADHLRVDLLDLDAVREAMAGVRAVVHAGAIPWERGDGSEVISTNVIGTWNVLQAAVEAGVERVVGLSSINAQGSVGGWRPTEYLPIDDSYPHHPMSPYQLSKHLMEEACRSFSERYALTTICLRPVFVAHPASQHADGFGSESFIETWRREFWAYVDIRDVSSAVLLSLELQDVTHDRFLLAAADTSVDVETRALIEQYYPDVPWPRLAPGTYLAGHDYRSLIDCHHARDVLGWAPRHSWRDGLATANGQES